MTETGLSDWVRGALPPCPDMFNAAAYCVGPSEVRPQDDIALRVVDLTAGRRAFWTFGEVEEAVRRVAGALKAAGVQKGDRVVLLLGDRPEFPFAYFGAIAAGAIACPLSSQLTAAEIEVILQQTDPAAILSADAQGYGAQARCLGIADLAGAPVEFAETHADDPASLVFTSGSSGSPKGVLHAQRSVWARQSMQAGWHDIQAGDRVLHAGAFNWTYTLGVGLADAWSVGANAIVNAGAKTPEIWSKLAHQEGATIFAAAPALFRRILKYGTELKTEFATLRHAVIAGDALLDSMYADWTARTGKPVLEALGMSEVSTYISTPPKKLRIAGHVGWPQPGRRVAILRNGAPVPFGEDGILAVHRSDPGLFLGYWRDEQATKAALNGEWFLTGDRAVMQHDGALRYLGREDDLMNAQGYRVDPAEVEAALLTHPSVLDCGVAALPVSDALSVIAAWVVGSSAETDALTAHMAARLAIYKCPREYIFVDGLPRNVNGKLLRRKLPNISKKDV